MPKVSFRYMAIGVPHCGILAHSLSFLLVRASRLSRVVLVRSWTVKRNLIEGK